MIPTKETALAFHEFRLGLIAAETHRPNLTILADLGREDLGFMLEHGLISPEEKIQMETEITAAVQSRLNELMPAHLRVVK